MATTITTEPLLLAARTAQAKADATDDSYLDDQVERAWDAWAEEVNLRELCEACGRPSDCTACAVCLECAPSYEAVGTLAQGHTATDHTA